RECTLPRLSIRRSRQTVLYTVFCLVFLVGGAPASFAHDDDDRRLLIFGDSLSDTGNAWALGAGISFRPFELIPSAPYFTLRFTNGRTWVERLAKKAGTPRTAKAVFLFPRKGRNYAIGGARARSVDGSSLLPDLPGQVEQFLLAHDSMLTPSDLVVMAVGGNDVRDAIVEFGDVIASGDSEDEALLASARILCQAVASIEENIGDLLERAGAQNLLVVNAPNLGVTPALTILGSETSMLGTELSMLFNLLLEQGDGASSPVQGICEQYAVSIQGLSSPEPLPRDHGVQIALFDVFGLLTDVTYAPEDFHLSNGTDACITPGVRFGAICWNPGPWKYVFWDGIHPTAAMHRIVAREAIDFAIAADLLPADSFAEADDGGFDAGSHDDE
ncbi:MAG: SGNH/GDSL hydrolase family protein, partial [Thiohalocapsa sp.]